MSRAHLYISVLMHAAIFSSIQARSHGKENLVKIRDQKRTQPRPFLVGLSYVELDLTFRHGPESFMSISAYSALYFLTKFLRRMPHSGVLNELK